MNYPNWIKVSRVTYLGTLDTKNNMVINAVRCSDDDGEYDEQSSIEKWFQHKNMRDLISIEVLGTTSITNRSLNKNSITYFDHCERLMERALEEAVPDLQNIYFKKLH